MPEVFLKVVEAKELLAKIMVKSSTKACEAVGLSRSTFYRYRNCIEPFDTERAQTLTLYLSLRDNPGVLASVLNILRKVGANVLTINQSMPISGVAPVCISMRNNKISQEIFGAVELLRSLEDVIEAKLIQF